MLDQRKTILIKNADYLVTMDKKRRILRNASLYIKGPEIEEVDSKRKKADKIIDASRMIVLPGFINCHHHMFQVSMRGLPQLQSQPIGSWIKAVVKISGLLDEEIIYYGALANMAELLLSGCTTTVDMHYIFPRGRKELFEAIIKAAKDIGIRFVGFRGSMDLEGAREGLFPADLIEEGDEIIRHSEEVVRTYHDSTKFSMCRIGLAPCTLFTNSSASYRDALILAKKYNLLLQTHVSESRAEVDYCLKKFAKKPVEFFQSLDFSGKNVSYVHCLNVDADEIKLIKSTESNVVHCPISNARQPIGQIGIAPITEMLEKGIKIGIGVDGSAGNDSSNILEEMRWARILQGARKEATYLKPTQVFEMATVGGAKALNRDDIGSLEKGKAADIVIFDPRTKLNLAGAVHDPVGSLVSSQAIDVDTVLINGKIVVENGKLLTIAKEKILRKFNRSCLRLINYDKIYGNFTRRR